MKSLKKFVLGLVLGAAALAQPAMAQKYVCMQSTQGEWCMKMLPEAAPATVANFLRYVEAGRYVDSLIHRSVPGFVIQGGGYDIDSAGQIGPVTSFGTINNEFNRSNLRGTVAMAKLGSDVNSATSQWFINLVDNTFLNDSSYGSFTVFAEVVYGMNVVDKIAALRVGDLSSALGDTAFGNLPIDLPAGQNTVGRENLVLVTRAYTTDLLPGSVLLPYHCTADVPAPAVTEYCGGTLALPVQIQGLAYEATLQMVAPSPLTFALVPGSLKRIDALPASYASFNPLTNEVSIPSVRVGALMYDSVVLKFAPANGQFTLTGFIKRN